LEANLYLSIFGFFQSGLAEQSLNFGKTHPDTRRACKPYTVHKGLLAPPGNDLVNDKSMAICKYKYVTLHSCNVSVCQQQTIHFDCIR